MVISEDLDFETLCCTIKISYNDYLYTGSPDKSLSKSEMFIYKPHFFSNLNAEMMIHCALKKLVGIVVFITL